MPDSESNDNTNKRPKRHAAQRANAYLYHEQASVLCWSEEKELKKALLASLQDAKRTNNANNTNNSSNSKTNNTYSNCDQTNNEKSAEYSENIDDSSICSKVASSSDGKESATVDDNNLCLLSLARRARIPAQRKFAQGSNNNSPISTPFKVGVVPTAPIVELFPNQRPKTEDFLTFLCLRRSPLLPPSLDFIGMNKKKMLNASVTEENANSDTDMSLVDDNEQTDTNTNEKYSLCRINSTDRRGSASSTVSKATSLSSKTSVNPSTSATRKSDIMKVNDNSISDQTKCLSKPLKRLQEKCCDNTNMKKQRELRPSSSSASLSSQPISKSHSKRSALNPNALASNETSSTSYNILKEKYKQQRIDKKTSSPSNHIKCIKNKDLKRSNEKSESKQLEGIQTRQRLRNFSYNNNQIEEKIVSTTTVNSNANISQRVLRSHHSSICTHSLSSLSTALLLHRVNRKSKQFNTSHVGVRPQKRKAKPVVPLIDYHFFSDSESDSSNKKPKNNRKKILESQHKTKYAKSAHEDDKFKNKVMLRKTYSYSKSPSPRPPGRPKANVTSQGKNKPKTSPQPRRLTRSSKRISPPKDAEALEKERLIKQQIIEIEKKHKRLRRFPSDISLHSSSTTSSSSSESLPNSSSSSSSINIPRLTRSLEHLKRIRDIAAKLKKEQKVEKKKTKLEESLAESKKKRKSVSKSSKKEKLLKSGEKREKQTKEKTISTSSRISESMTNSDTDCQPVNSSLNNDCEDSIASANSDIDEDIESASKGFLQDMAEEINTLDELTTEGDQPLPELVYCNTEHIQGLMTTEFSGAFSEETVTTASAILLPSSSASYQYMQSRNTVDASTNTTEDDLLECLAVKTDYKLSVGTQTITPANSPQVADSNK